MHGDDELLMRFLAEMVHPAVRPAPGEAVELVEMVNEKLAPDGWMLTETKQISGRPVYEGRRVKGSKQPTTSLRIPEYQRLRDPEVFHEHLRRIDNGH
jgi:hypothetical protein